jgi:hypothetical protein
MDKSSLAQLFYDEVAGHFPSCHVSYCKQQTTMVIMPERAKRNVMCHVLLRADGMIIVDNNQLNDYEYEMIAVTDPACLDRCLAAIRKVLYGDEGRAEFNGSGVDAVGSAIS